MNLEGTRYRASSSIDSAAGEGVQGIRQIDVVRRQLAGLLDAAVRVALGDGGNGVGREARRGQERRVGYRRGDAIDADALIDKLDRQTAYHVDDGRLARAVVDRPRVRAVGDVGRREYQATASRQQRHHRSCQEEIRKHVGPKDLLQLRRRLVRDGVPLRPCDDPRIPDHRLVCWLHLLGRG